MSKYEAAFKAALAEAERRICLDVLRSSPELSLAELHKLGRGRLSSVFAELTVGELVRGAADAAPPTRGRKAAAGARSSAAAKPAPEKADAAPPAVPEVNTRTVEGREAYDVALYGAVKDIGRPARVAEIIARVGGTNLQARAGLTRLINAGKLTWTGKARGTKYSLV